MTTILIILGVFVSLFIVRKTLKKRTTSNELEELVNKINKEIFPNGKEDIKQGTNKLLQILNNSIDKKTAEIVFIKSAAICYITSMKGTFSKERLKKHLAPYALQYFNNNTLDEFYNYLLSYNEKINSFNELVKISREFSKSSNPTDISDDKMPEGYGEYGLELTNPIPTSSIPDSYFYLDRLKTKDGSKITFERIGSMNAPNIKHTIDAYKIFSEGKKIATIYICPYNSKTSSKAPKGFILD